MVNRRVDERRGLMWTLWTMIVTRLSRSTSARKRPIIAAIAKTSGPQVQIAHAHYQILGVEEICIYVTSDKL
jgi:hypothetical protein